jgi:hypothetical protein
MLREHFCIRRGRFVVGSHGLGKFGFGFEFGVYCRGKRCIGLVG